MRFIGFNVLLIGVAGLAGWCLSIWLGDWGWILGGAAAGIAIWPLFAVRVLGMGEGKAWLNVIQDHKVISKGVVWMTPAVFVLWICLDREAVILGWLGIAVLCVSEIGGGWHGDEEDYPGVFRVRKDGKRRVFDDLHRWGSGSSDD